MTNSIYIGKSFNLLEEFDALNTGSSKIESVLKAPLKLSQVASESNSMASWDNLQLSLLNCSKSLLEYLGTYESQESNYDGDGYYMSPNFLNEHSYNDLLKKYSSKFEIELKPNSTYIVLEIQRKEKTLSHEVFDSRKKATLDRNKHLSKEWGFDSLKLRPGKKISYNKYFDTELVWARAQKYIDKFYSYGTHFVSKITYGDRILQFFEIKPESVHTIVSHYKNINLGLPLKGFQTSLFNALLNEQYCSSISRIVSLAKDKGLEKLVESDLFNGVGSSIPNLILASTWNTQMLSMNLKPLTKSTETKVLLCSLGRFMGYFRSINFDRILKGALAQRWGRKVAFPIRRLDNVTHTLKAIDLFPKTQMKLNNSISYFGDIFDGSQKNFFEKEFKQLFFRVIKLNETSEDFQLQNTSLSSQFLEGASITSQSPKITLSHDQFINTPIFCNKMYGSILLINEGNNEEHLVYDGYRFGLKIEESTGRKKVFLVSDILKPTSIFKANMETRLDTYVDFLAEYKANRSHNDSRISSFLLWISSLSNECFSPNNPITNRSIYLANSINVSPIIKTFSKNETAEWSNKIKQFLNTCSSIDGFYDAKIYNLHSLNPEHQIDESLIAPLKELNELQQIIDCEYKELLHFMLKKVWQLVDVNSCSFDQLKAAFNNQLLSFNSLLSSKKYDEIVDYLFYFLSKIVSLDELFTPHKNVIKSRFEEQKIKIARNFSSILVPLLMNSIHYQEIKAEIIEKREEISKQNLFQYTDQTNNLKSNSNYEELFRQVKKILKEETSMISDNEFKIYEIFDQFTSLIDAQEKLHSTIRAFLELKANLQYMTTETKSVLSKKHKLLTFNGFVAKVKYCRNYIKSLESKNQSNQECQRFYVKPTQYAPLY